MICAVVKEGRKIEIKADSNVEQFTLHFLGLRWVSKHEEWGETKDEGIKRGILRRKIL